jgi:hypothetical protein
MDDRVNKPTFAIMGINFPEGLRGLIEDPPLLQGEDPKLYWNLLVAVIDEEKPQGIMDYIDVMDQVNKVWEEWRLKRVSVGLINGEMLSAVDYFLAPLEMKPISRSKLARDYFGEKPKVRQKVVSKLAQYGVTLPEIQAKAVQLNRPTLQLTERMIAARENGRRQLRKDKRNRRQETDGSLE